MGRLPFFAGNWKMNKTVGEALDLVKGLKAAISGVIGVEGEVEVAVAPPFTALYAVRKEIEGSSIFLAAQNLYWEEKGAFTGEISPLMLKEVGCHYVIIGHSERRQFFGETDETVNRRIKAALAQGLKVIFCIGETLKEREGGKTFSVIERQMEGGLKGLDDREMGNMVIAYEPVWAIGTGKTATPEQAEEVHRFIRGKIEKLYSRGVSEEIRIQYGGSVTPENIKGLMNQPNIDGALVGGASLKAESFSKIVRFKEL
ncbi:MAG: triose-phosphate isomerase [Deltaproteobacteria bacterium CG_4_8_14_3_um_filter_45_9]|nr:MAG: triose-phosphate isomerase [Deltaproteobacteria bacterium CG_4_8_14_3_um_filter_45_9]